MQPDNEIMDSPRQRREQQGELLRTVLAGLCIVLVLLVGAAQLLHSHGANAPSDASCSLCLVAHLAASPAPIVAGPAVAGVSSPVGPADRVFSVPRTPLLVLFIRPPPVLIPHA
jgi:hypothetical protein